METGVNANQPTPPSAGQPDVAAELEKLKQHNAELERKASGLLDDLKSERTKRQQLEQVKQNPPTPAGNPAVDPVDQLFMQKTLPVVQNAIAYEKAKSFVASKAGVDPDDVESSDAWREVVDFAQKRGIMGSSPDKTAKLAWALLQQEKDVEKRAKEDAEKQRLAAISSNSSVSTSAASAPASGSAKTLTEKEIEKMSLAEYAKVRESIAKGEIKILG